MRGEFDSESFLFMFLNINIQIEFGFYKHQKGEILLQVGIFKLSSKDKLCMLQNDGNYFQHRIFLGNNLLNISIKKNSSHITNRYSRQLSSNKIKFLNEKTSNGKVKQNFWH